MTCPVCGNTHTRVYGTKKRFTNTRFRICEECGAKFMTVEVLREDLFSKDYNDYLEDIGELEADLRHKALRG
ncbi:hypothetical protein [Sulfurimonas sp.]|uniref:NrdR family transcriptional regulator n=1 Tax=Sulfurimonas sp. TaxID=2022749 RepID=UPI001A005DAD|nr:hypothetical protein [Sulfurimonas sp.]MBE0515729.1 hypothetical protein [Sulfurimonas sp.]